MSTWVLLRGVARESRHWGDFPAALRDRVGASRIVMLDLPGSGRLHAESSPTRVEAMVEKCRVVLARFDLPPPYTLFALSLGGMVAVAWAARYPEEVRAAVLVNTSMRGFGAWHQRLRPRNYLRLLKMLTLGDAEAIELDVISMTTRHPRTPEAELLARWTEWRRSHPVARVNVLRQLRAAAAFRAPSDRPRVPLLVLASAGDGLVDPLCSMRMARRWNAELAMHPTAGHDLPLDDPEWVARQTAAWVERERLATDATAALVSAAS